jgi:hypothetical protein
MNLLPPLKDKTNSLAQLRNERKAKKQKEKEESALASPKQQSKAEVQKPKVLEIKAKEVVLDFDQICKQRDEVCF